MVSKMLSWTPTYQEFQSLISSDYTLRILVLIHKMSDDGHHLCAADVSKMMGIHITTAKKNLDLLSQIGFISGEVFANKPGKPTYFSIKHDIVNINLDLNKLADTANENMSISTLPSLLIREQPNLSPRVIYKFDDNGLVTEIVVKKKTKGKKSIKQRIVLKKNETSLMKYLPHPTMKLKSFQDILRNIGIEDYYIGKILYNFVIKLKKYEIIEVKEIPTEGK